MPLSILPQFSLILPPFDVLYGFIPQEMNNTFQFLEFLESQTD